MDSFSVEELFHPFSWRDFSNQYFEEKVLLIKRNAPDFFQNLLTIPQVDEVLFSQQVTHPSFRVVDSKTGEFTDPGTYTQNGSTNINPIEFCSYFTKGGTLTHRQQTQQGGNTFHFRSGAKSHGRAWPSGRAGLQEIEVRQPHHPHPQSMDAKCGHQPPHHLPCFPAHLCHLTDLLRHRHLCP